MRGMVIVATIVLCALICGTAFAAYLDNVTHKVDRGFSNALGCWLEIPYQTYAAAKERGVMAGVPMGLGKGLAMLPLRLLSGAGDLVTFPMPCPMTGWNGWMTPEYNPWVEQPEPETSAPPQPEQPAQAQ